MATDSPGPALDRPMFVFTDESGAVVLIEDDLARLLGHDTPEEAVGDPLSTVLGMATGEAMTLLREVAAQGNARHRPLQIRSRKTGRVMWVLLSGTAHVAEGRFIGADIVITPAGASLRADDFDHRADLERMAGLVRSRMRNGGRPAMSEEKELELRSYLAARMLAIYVLIVRMGGRPVGEAFEERIRSIGREHGSIIDMSRGRLILGKTELTPEVCRQITHIALGYAIQVTSKRLVTRELAELDVNFTPATIQRAEHYGLRAAL